MITNAIINLGYYLISFIIGIFPTGGGFGVDIHNSAKMVGGYLDIISPLVPITTLLATTTLLFTFEIGVFGFKTLKWIVSHIPFIGGK